MSKRAPCSIATYSSPSSNRKGPGILFGFLASQRVRPKSLKNNFSFKIKKYHFFPSWTLFCYVKIPKHEKCAICGKGRGNRHFFVLPNAERRKVFFCFFITVGPKSSSQHGQGVRSGSIAESAPNQVKEGASTPVSAPAWEGCCWEAKKKAKPVPPNGCEGPR